MIKLIQQKTDADETHSVRDCMSSKVGFFFVLLFFFRVQKENAKFEKFIEIRINLKFKKQKKYERERERTLNYTQVLN